MDIEQLFHQQRRKLSWWLYRMVRCEETAADLVQETYARLFSAAGVQSVTHPRALLFRTATNLALDHLRKEKHRAASMDLEAALEVPAGAPSPERVLFDKERFAIFCRALEALPPRCRDVFVLHKMHDVPYGGIAVRLGISESAVEKHMIRALAHCRKALLEEQLPHPRPLSQVSGNGRQKGG